MEGGDNNNNKNNNENIINDSTMSLLFHGCDLAKKMELDISNSMWVGGGGAPPLIVAQKCEEIIEVFNTAKQQLSNSGGCLHQLPLDYHHPYQPAEMEAVFEYAHHHHPNNKGKGKEEVRVSLKADSGGKDQEFGVHGIMTDIGGSSTLGLRSSSSRRSSSR